MLNTCPACGQYRADKTIVSSPDRIVCPECGAAFPFLRLPLFVLSGASGTGKSTVINLLVGPELPTIALDSDILWSETDAAPEHWSQYFDRWLRLCKNIGQSGRPVLLSGAGFGVPENLENCSEARYFSEFHIAALICSESQLVQRLRGRPSWRNSNQDSYISEQVKFNQWFSSFANGSHPFITVLDTTDTTPTDTADQIRRWLEAKIL